MPVPHLCVFIPDAPRGVFYIFSVRVCVCVCVCVCVWTINIHDRVTWNLPFVNGAAHHTVHHTGFNYNYGQYLVFWDKLGGSYRDPFVTAPYNGTPLDKEKRFKTS